MTETVTLAWPLAVKLFISWHFARRNLALVNAVKFQRDRLPSFLSGGKGCYVVLVSLKSFWSYFSSSPRSWLVKIELPLKLYNWKPTLNYCPWMEKSRFAVLNDNLMVLCFWLGFRIHPWSLLRRLLIQLRNYKKLSWFNLWSKEWGCVQIHC